MSERRKGIYLKRDPRVLFQKHYELWVGKDLSEIQTEADKKSYELALRRERDGLIRDLDKSAVA